MMNNITYFTGLITNFLSVLIGEGISTGNEDTLTNYPELGVHWS
jgi:hypothetical protein